MEPGEPGWLALHCTGQATAERVCRKLHRSAARRVPERDAVHLAAPGPCRAGGVAALSARPGRADNIVFGSGLVSPVGLEPTTPRLKVWSSSLCPRRVRQAPSVKLLKA